MSQPQQPQQVHTMTDYYDGPRGGVAEFGGRPHVYRSMWADINHDRPDVFELSPIDDETLALALEDWQIWRRWEAAFHRNLVTGDTHPALPEDRQRHDELILLLAPLLEIHSPADITAAANFEWQPAGTEPLGRPLRVTWTVVDRPEDCITFDDDAETDA